MTSTDEPLLRTLSPLLRELGRGLRNWLDAPHAFPLNLINRATLEGLCTDLQRQADALDMDRPLLIIMLMGGTGVGKSTLLNALAGAADVAQAAMTRPTTKDPVVYFHESVKPDRLPAELQRCRLKSHSRQELLQKVLVDTPDLDSNDLSNREILMGVLPVADVVLYVGSQEKYHDKLGWDLFMQQRKRRAFGFVLNKWDRCQHAGAAGLRPDEDLVRDLENEGFKQPRLFRTCAQLWVDLAKSRVQVNGEPPPITAAVPEGLPEGEQFQDLVNWLNHGISRLEIDAIKARGISQLLQQLIKALTDATPPDLTDLASRTRSSWERLLAEEAKSVADVLLNTLEPYQREIEHHFSVESQRRFRGLMSSYLNLFTKVKYAGNSMIRDRFSLLPRPTQTVESTTSWDLGKFTQACSSAAGERHLDARGRALANRLLVESDRIGFPMDLLRKPTEAISSTDWRQRYDHSLREIFEKVEKQWSNPSGARRVVQNLIIWLADWLPPIALLASCALLLWQYTMAEPPRHFEWSDILLPFIVVLIVLIILHILISLVLPLRWPAVRDEFHRQIEQRLLTDLETAYISLPGEVAGTMRQEREKVEKLSGQTREVAEWLQRREQDASVAVLYGN